MWIFKSAYVHSLLKFMFYDSSPYQSLTNRANSTKQSIDAGYYVEDICILFCVIYSM